MRVSLGPQAGNPEDEEDQNADEHDNSRCRLLPACGSKVATVFAVIADSSRALFPVGARIAALTEMPRFLAIAPGADLGSGYEAAIAAHRNPLRRIIHRV